MTWFGVVPGDAEFRTDGAKTLTYLMNNSQLSGDDSPSWFWEMWPLMQLKIYVRGKSFITVWLLCVYPAEKDWKHVPCICLFGSILVHKAPEICSQTLFTSPVQKCNLWFDKYTYLLANHPNYWTSWRHTVYVIIFFNLYTWIWLEGSEKLLGSIISNPISDIYGWCFSAVAVPAVSNY